MVHTWIVVLVGGFGRNVRCEKSCTMPGIVPEGVYLKIGDLDPVKVIRSELALIRGNGSVLQELTVEPFYESDTVGNQEIVNKLRAAGFNNET